MTQTDPRSRPETNTARARPAAPQQARARATRARLLDASRVALAEGGAAALKIEEITRTAGVAKGTFFAHFEDRDGLLDVLIGEKLGAEIDKIAALKGGLDPDDLAEALTPVVDLLASERAVFEVVLRRSGAGLHDQEGPIAQALWRMITTLADSFACRPPRTDADPMTLAEGVQAFVTQTAALILCGAARGQTPSERLRVFLRAWLAPR